MSDERKFLPSIGDLIDRLSIDQIKEVLIPAHKEQYAKEINDILYDIEMLLPKQQKITAEFIRAIVVISQMNLHIWQNETKCRNGERDGNNLYLSHGLNGIRCEAKNRINSLSKNGSIDWKVDCLAADFKDWEVSWNKQVPL